MDTWYERLSGLDQAFLHFETQSTYMHVALTAIFEGGSLGRSGGGLDIKRIRRHIASRLRFIPRYRQRLAFVPMTNDPVWVDDADFDLAYHVRHTRIPNPGTDRQLQTLCARLLEQPLDRRRPLWELWLIEGLAGGHFAMLCKVHHCMVDGIAGVDILAALLGMQPQSDSEKVERWTPRPAPDGPTLLRDDIQRRARTAWSLMQRAPRMWRGELPTPTDLGGRISAVWDLVRTGLDGSADTPLNQPISAHRRVDWLSFELSAIKAIKTRLGGALNDVVLTTISGALRRFFMRRGETINGEFRVLVPVSVRTQDERGQTGNRVSMWLTPLPLDEADLLRCYSRIRETTERYKNDHSSLGGEVLTQTADWTTSLVVGLATRLLTRSRVFNLIVTNVPGPPMPLFLLDAPMVAAYPHVPLFENQGLGIALFSYADRFTWGFVGDWDMVADIHNLCNDVQATFNELQDAAGLTKPQAATPTKRLPRQRPMQSQIVTHEFAAAAL
ncbi:MAG TPA: wax ester/triacylglycerol synthase family O-acyltransferase [Candidatus Acidoferrales bacterium]|nr:wax ester/triacylglycerol synthase family O-acyltransferase [Candidatus Acidoferrales bacterium]